MNEIIKKIQIIFGATFGTFVIIGGGVLLLKTQGMVEDMIDMSSKLTMIIPVIMILTILAGYVIYDRMAKSAQKSEDESQRLQKFQTATIIRMAMFEFVGFLVSVMIVMIYQKTYVYMLGIVAIFFLINFPKELHYKKYFDNNESFFDK